MKPLSGILVFVAVFAAVGIAMHAGLYGKPGIFIWSLSTDTETGGHTLARTTLALDAGASAATPVTGPSGGASDAPTAAAAEQPPGTEPGAEPAPAGESVEKSKTSPKGKSAGKGSDQGEANGGETESAGASDDGNAETEQPEKIALFDGETLGQWEKTRFGGEGDVFVDEDGNLEFGFGAIMTGVHWGGEVPATSNYEISLEAMKLDGYDFFCALTFPVKDSFATFVIGGWGGGVVGISSVDDLDASENETMNIEGFENDRWYRVRVRVTDERLQAWIDDDQKVDLALENRKISLRPGDIELCKPIGIASFQTRSQYRDIVWHPLPDGS